MPEDATANPMIRGTLSAKVEMRIYRIVNGFAGLTFVVVASVFCSSLQAQEIQVAQVIQQNIQPGVIDRPPVDVPRELERLPTAPLRKEPVLERPAKPDEIVATVSRVVFSGITVLDEESIQAAATPYLDRPLSRADIAQLKFDVTKLYYDKGYILARVITPPQDLSTGELKVVVYEARIGELKIRSEDALRPWLVEALSSRVKEGAVFREQTAESMVNDFNDLGNVSAVLNLQPGKEVGTSDMVLVIEPVEEDEQIVSFDNYNSELIGERSADISLTKSNLLRMGETVGVNLDVTEDRSWSGEVRLGAPVGWRNLRLDLRYFRSKIDIGGELAILDSSGESEIFGAALSSALINMRRQKLMVGGGFEARTHESFLFGEPLSRDDIRRAFLDGSYLLRLPNSTLYGSLRLSKGLDVFGASDERDVDISRFDVGADSEAWRLEPLLFAYYQATIDDSVRAIITGQLASTTLLSSDLFSIGGYGSVRGFEPGQATGEAGVQFSVEYNHRFAIDDIPWVTVQAGPFFDGGAVFNRLSSEVTGVQDDRLFSVGIGLELTFAALPVGESRLRLDWAFPVGHYKLDELESSSFFFRFSQLF